MLRYFSCKILDMCSENSKPSCPPHNPFIGIHYGIYANEVYERSLLDASDLISGISIREE